MPLWMRWIVFLAGVALMVGMWIRQVSIAQARDRSYEDPKDNHNGE